MTKSALTIIIITVVLSILIPIVAILLIDKKYKLKLWVKITVPITFITIVNLCGFLAYFFFYYHATEEVVEYLKDSDKVRVSSAINYYYFDNIENDDTAIIFYGGAKVEEKSYAPMMHQLAENGYDVYLLKIPLRFALFSQTKADHVYKSIDQYENVYLMGHSLGGVCAAIDLVQTELDYEGIIMLASYSNKPIDNKYKALTIYGTEDRVMNRKEYEKNIVNLPNGYVSKIIEGGNHANYGYYGAQKGDGEATISREQQIDLTVSYIVDFINA